MDEWNFIAYRQFVVIICFYLIHVYLNDVYTNFTNMYTLNKKQKLTESLPESTSLVNCIDGYIV